MHKKFLLIILLCLIMSGCTFTNSQAGMIFSNRPINQNNLNSMSYFQTGERIYFAVFTKKTFRDDVIEYQLVKRDTKVPSGGYKIIYAKRDKLKNERYYMDYVMPNSEGEYYIQLYELNNLKVPLVSGGFKVCN